MRNRPIDEEILNDLRTEIDNVRDEMKELKKILKSARIKSDIYCVYPEIVNLRRKLKDLLKQVQKLEKRNG